MCHPWQVRPAYTSIYFKVSLQGSFKNCDMAITLKCDLYFFEFENERFWIEVDKNGYAKRQII